MPELSLHLANDFTALGPASDEVREFLCNCSAPDAATFFADLVIEELVTNTIKYGYDDAVSHAIHVDLEFDRGRLCIAVRDSGHPFDPLAQAPPDFSIPADERPIGGLGIHLVRQMSDEVRYERRENENVVTASKAFPEDE
jgi:serine/threonine-protein kinase RsbW